VAATRAMDELYITYCTRRLVHGKKTDTTPSRYLSDIPDTCAEAVARGSGRSRQARGTKRGTSQLPLF
jgi:superfamily I DNA/RNA helicase